VFKGVTDPLVARQYIGFVCTASVTAFELAIKDIFLDFAARKHNVFGAFVSESYKRMNGRIKLDELRKNNIQNFGQKYLKRFDRKLKDKEEFVLGDRGKSIRSSYGNVITWRHVFIHEGEVPSNASFKEAVEAFEVSKELISVLNETMVR
jgi:hypothetical protein